MASDDLKQLVAREITQGDSIATVARRHGYSWKGMKKLTTTVEVKRLVGAERDRVSELADQHRAQLVLLGSPAIENIRAAVENPRHPKNLEMSRFVLEKILPTRTALDAQVQIEPRLRPDVQNLINEGMFEVASLLEELRDFQLGNPRNRVGAGEDALPVPPSLPPGFDPKTSQ